MIHQDLATAGRSQRERRRCHRACSSQPTVMHGICLVDPEVRGRSWLSMANVSRAEGPCHANESGRALPAGPNVTEGPTSYPPDASRTMTDGTRHFSPAAIPTCTNGFSVPHAL